MATTPERIEYLKKLAWEVGWDLDDIGPKGRQIKCSHSSYLNRWVMALFVVHFWYG